MSDELAALMGTMALYIVHERDWPLGYTESGFIRWLQPRKPLAPAPSTEHAANKAQSALDAHS